MGVLPVPQIQIRTEKGRLGFEAPIGKIEIQQPPVEIEMKTTPAKVEIEQPRGELDIDQSKAWDALALSATSDLMPRIYSQCKDIALRGIARIVEQGNRMAAIHQGGNVIAEIAQEEWKREGELVTVGEPSYDNVDIQYKANKPEYQIERGKYDLRVEPHQPEIHFNPGKFESYLIQKPSIEITPPLIDLKV